MTLAQQILADVPSIFLNGNEFAEQVTYFFAAGGAPLVVNALVDLSIQPVEEQFEKRDLQTIVVGLAIDPAGVVGLAQPPAHGDFLRRTGNGDPPAIAYAFVGEIEDAGYGLYAARFVRRRITQSGITQ